MYPYQDDLEDGYMYPYQDYLEDGYICTLYPCLHLVVICRNSGAPWLYAEITTEYDGIKEYSQLARLNGTYALTPAFYPFNDLMYYHLVTIPTNVI